MWLFLVLGCADVTGIEKGAEVGPGVVLKDWFTSALVVRSGEATVLFDGGYRVGTMEKRLEGEGLTASDIDAAFVTHGHSDHLAFLPELDGPVYALEAERALIDEEGEGEIDIEVIEDGSVVEVNGLAVEVFAVPGHTAGSAVFLVEGLLVLGDSALQNKDGLLVPVAEKRSDDPEQLVESMQALADRLAPRRDEIAWLVPAHSAPMRGFAPLESFPEGP